MASARKVVIEFVGEDKSLSRTANQADSRMSKLGGRLKSVGKLAAGGLAAGVVVAGAALFKMGQAAMEDAAGQARLAKTLKNTAGATDAQIAATEDWITAQGKALGVSDDELRPAMEKLVRATGDVGEAQKLASLAMDISAGSGQSLETVSKSLMKAQNGQVSGLSKLGIETKDAEGKTISFQEATKRLSSTFKGSAEANANTLQGKIGRLKLILSETGEEIGAKLIPVVSRMADWFLNKGLPAMQHFGAYLQRVLPPIFEKIRAVVSRVMGGLRGDVGGNMKGIRQVFSDAVSIIQRIWSLFGKNIVQYLKATFKNLMTVLRGAFQVIRGIFRTVSALLKGDWKGAWEGIKTILRGAAKIVLGIVRQMWNLIRFAFKNAGVALRGVFRAIWDGIKSIARNGMSWLVDSIRSIPGRIANLHRAFGNAGRSLINALVNGMKNAAGVISGIAGNVWSAVKGMLNGAISKINAALEFRIDTPGPGGVTINPPNIPYLAKGTNFHKGGLAVVGEKGPELVNLPRGSRVTSNAESMGALRAATGGGMTVNIYAGVGDPVAIGREVEKVMVKFERAVGRRVQFGAGA